MFTLIQLGGPVMWFLLVTSVLALILFLDRLLNLHRAQIKAADFLKGIYNILHRQNVVEAISICEETPGPVARIVHAAVLRHDEGRERIQEAIQQAGLSEIPRLGRNLGLVLTLAQIAPLLGLLGTILGLMDLLQAIQQNAPLVHAGDLAAGLWRALICSATGLVIAIPTYAGYNFLVSRVTNLVLEMDRAAAELLAVLCERNGHKERPGA